MSREAITGIVGGVGPYAGLDLVGRILRNTAAARDQDHLPLIHLSIPGEISDRSDFLLGKSRVSPAAAIARQAGLAADMGAAMVAIPCNTAHHPSIFNEVAERLARRREGVYLFNMVREAGRRLAAGPPGARRIGLLATRGTCAGGVYEHWLSGSGVEVLCPTGGLGEEVHRAIYDPAHGIKATGRLTAPAAGAIARAAGQLAARGATGLLLACTELSLVRGEIPETGLPVLDANTILARAIIGRAAPEKLRPDPPEG